MYLINTKTLRLQQFTSEKDQEYIILSHRWEEDEILYEDMQNLSACNKSGKHKLLEFCKLAKYRGVRYVWMDTCCIDKKSSAELSEAINSMYKYYQVARECIVYLCDVHAARNSPVVEEEFQESVWFTRCWTLQELIAPSRVEFYNSRWEPLGTKHDLSGSIQAITHIGEEALLNGSLQDFSIAQKMSWASDRSATRTEDVAYSLMGIFGINMPMLYGEGDKAFRRLQEEIIRSSDDETIFAWNYNDGDTLLSDYFAPSPAQFRGYENVKFTKLHKRETGYSMTKRGIHIELEIRPYLDADGNYLALLNASHRKTDVELFIGIWLRGNENEDECDFPHEFTRTPGRWTGSVSEVLVTVFENRKIWICNEQSTNWCYPKQLYGFKFKSLYGFDPDRLGLGRKHCAPGVEWRRSLMLSHRIEQCGPYCKLDMPTDFPHISSISLGISNDRCPVCIVFYHFASRIPDDLCYNFSDDSPPYGAILKRPLGIHDYLPFLVEPFQQQRPGVLVLKAKSSRRTRFLCPDIDAKSGKYKNKWLFFVNFFPDFERLTRVWEFSIEPYEAPEKT